MRSILFLLGGLVAASLCGAGGARADVEYPWCAQYFDGAGASNCGFESEEQCRLAAQGAGGICSRNLNYVAPPVVQPAPAAAPPPPAPAKKRR